MEPLVIVGLVLEGVIILAMLVTLVLAPFRFRQWRAEVAARRAGDDVPEPALSAWQVRKQRAAARAVTVVPRGRRGRSNIDRTIAAVSAILDEGDNRG